MNVKVLLALVLIGALVYFGGAWRAAVLRPERKSVALGPDCRTDENILLIHGTARTPDRQPYDIVPTGSCDIRKSDGYCYFYLPRVSWIGKSGATYTWDIVDSHVRTKLVNGVCQILTAEITNPGSRYIYTECATRPDGVYDCRVTTNRTCLEIGGTYCIDKIIREGRDPTSTGMHLKLVPETIPSPTPTPPANIGEWIFARLKSLIDRFLKLLGLGAEIIGTTSVAPGGTATFNINIVVANPDADYTDGTYQAQYAGWALYDRNYNIVRQAAEWKMIQGSYTDTVTLTMPTATGRYAFTVVIIQYDMNFTGGKWVQSPETILAQEGASVTVAAPAPNVVTKPVGSWFSNLVASLMNLVRSLLGLR